MSHELVVLAAGMGSRYGGLKQIDPVGPNGELVIDYSVFDAMRTGFDRVIFVIREDMQDAFRDGIGKAMEARLDVDYAFQRLDDLPSGFTPPPDREKPWGTGHAVYAARHAIRKTFAVINADDFYGAGAFRLLSDHLSCAASGRDTLPVYAMIAYQLINTVSEHGTVSRGLCRTNSLGELTEIEEVTAIEKMPDGIFSRGADGSRIPHDGTMPVSMNCWGFLPDVLTKTDNLFRRFLEKKGRELKSEFYLPEAVGNMIADGLAKVRLLQTSDPWYGVTYREDKPLVMQGILSLVKQGLYPEKLWG